MSETTGSAGNALFSVYDKDGRNESERVEVFAAGLVDLGWNIYASGGTHKRLAEEAGLPATDVAELVGGGAILGHKVVTLSREIAAGLLSDPSDADEMAEMKQLGLPIIHLLCQDSYPLEEEIFRDGSTPQSVLKQTDIGGPTLLREGAKLARIFGTADEQRELAQQGLRGGRMVLSVPEQRQQVLEWLRAGRPDEAEFLAELAARATYEVARYTMLEAKYWMGSKMSGHIALLHTPTKYGENAPQVPSGFYADNRVNINPLGLDQDVHVQGMERSHINMTDMHRSRQTLIHLTALLEQNLGVHRAIAIGAKHNNACGVGVADTLEEAVKKMLEGDNRAIHGGVVTLNGEITEEIATLLVSHATPDGKKRLLDGVVGTSATPEAMEILSREKLRLVTNAALSTITKDSFDKNRQFTQVLGGVLEQPNDTFVFDFAADYVEVLGELTDEQKEDLLVALAVSRHSNSNTIIIGGNGQLIGPGVGQQDRVGASQLALTRTTTKVPELVDAGDHLEMTIQLDKAKLANTVAVSDSFFGFADAAELLADAGVKAIMTTWNTDRHKEIIEEIHAKGVTMVIMPDKVGRGFSNHS